MNKNTIFIIFVIIIAIIGYVAWKGSRVEPVQETPVQALDKNTQADSTAQIDSNLNSINADQNADADLNSIDADIKAL
jgi:flagellar basal body-associated protein FliL